jgi:hypothetical protein
LYRVFSICALVIAASLPVWADPDPREQEGAAVFDLYQQAVRQQSESGRNVSMEVTMEASIPKLKKHGRLNALRHISNLGRITYKILGFSGDNTVKKEVMARYMTAEVEAAQSRKIDVGISPENYSFKYKGETDKGGRRVHVFELKPKQKRLGLFKGELWVDPETYLPVREAGRLVKNPSLFIKRMEFVREYEIRDGFAWLVSLDSKTDTRIVGKAELHINYTNFARNMPGETLEEETGSEPTVEEARTAKSFGN